MPPFETLIAAHGAAVWRACAAVVGPAEADDAWQETMLAALRAYPDAGEHPHPRAWLLTIAHRKALDAVRARNRRGVPAGHDTLDAVHAGRAAPADALAEVIVAPGEPSTGELWGLVAALPDAQRLALAYHYLGGLTHADTATLLGRSPVALRRAASDGLRALRARLNQETPT